LISAENGKPQNQVSNISPFLQFCRYRILNQSFIDNASLLNRDAQYGKDQTKG
jgi:hypothetical protein